MTREFATMLPMRRPAAVLAVLAAMAGGGAARGADVPIPPRAAALTCINPHSGTSWQIKIDYEKGTVDANPARISSGEISWFDPADGGKYTLDRRSGKLTFVAASSTGGYFLFDQCRPAD